MFKRRTPQSKEFTSKRNKYERDNLACARLILADVERYGGELSLMVQWARIVNPPVERAEDSLPLWRCA